MYTDTIKELYCFPLRNETKIPNEAWKERAIKGKPNSETYAIDCGKSNLVVIDIDMHNDVNGILEWTKLIRDVDITDTLTISTPNGGIHYYYYDTTGGKIKNSVSKIAPGIDVRANGGYVVGPRSIIRSEDGELKEYAILNDTEIAVLPEFLKSKLLPFQYDKNTSVENNLLIDDYVKEDTSQSLSEQDVKKYIRNSFNQVLNAKDGHRNEVLNKEVFLLKKNLVPEDIIINQMTIAATLVGLDDAEINATIQSALKAKINKQVNKDSSLINSPLNSPAGYFTEAMIAKRISQELNIEKYLYLNGTNNWTKYNVFYGIWEHLTEEQLMDRIKVGCFKEVDTAAEKKDPDFIKASLKCLNKNTMKNVAYLCRLNCLIDPKLFDKDPYLIVVKNGVINLKTKELKDFSPDYYITRRINLNYNSHVKSKYLDKIIMALPDDAIDWFYIMVGQSLTGQQPSSDRMFFMNGGGANGKSTILNLMTATAGDYGGLPPQSSLIRSTNGNDNFNMILYKNINQAIIEELPDKQLDTVRLKNLTGTDQVTARGLYKDNETFKLKCTIWVSCNILPQVTEYDYGTWRRIALIPFTKTFKKTKAEITHPSHKLGNDKVRWAALHDTATQEEFLARRVNGAYEWYKNHEIDPELPQSVIDATNHWRESGDNIRLWFNDTFVKDYGYYVLNEDARDSYNNWLRQKGYATISHKNFLDKLENHAIFQENDLSIARKSKIGQLQQSFWNDPIDTNKKQRIGGSNSSHIKFIKFK